MTLQEIGDLLRAERERQGLSVDDIMARSKISRKNLLALEEGERRKLPQDIFLTGFIKSYSTLLGLDAETILADYVRSGIPDEESVETKLRRHAETVRAAGPPKAWKGIVAAGFVLLAGLVIAYLLFSPSEVAMQPQAVQEGGHLSAVPETDVVRPDAAQPGAARVAPPDVLSAPSGLPSSTANATGENATGSESIEANATVQENRNASSVGELPDVALPQGVTAGATRTATDAEQRAEEQIVRIQAKEAACWFRATTAEGRVVERLLRPGEEMQISFSTSLTLKLGNLKGVAVLHNGKPVTFGPWDGQPVTVTIPQPAGQ